MVVVEVVVVVVAVVVVVVVVGRRFLLKNSAIVGIGRNHPPTHPINRGPNNNCNNVISLLLVVEFTLPNTYPPTPSALLDFPGFSTKIEKRPNTEPQGVPEALDGTVR